MNCSNFLGEEIYRHDTLAKSWFARRDHQCEHSVQEPAGLDGILIPPQRLKTTRIVTMPVLMVASAWVLHYAVGGAGGEPPANENREAKSNMTDEKVIMLIEAKIQPQRRTELVEAARQYLPLVRAEPGVEAFYRWDVGVGVFPRREAAPVGKAGVGDRVVSAYVLYEKKQTRHLSPVPAS